MEITLPTQGGSEIRPNKDHQVVDASLGDSHVLEMNRRGASQIVCGIYEIRVHSIRASRIANRKDALEFWTIAVWLLGFRNSLVSCAKHDSRTIGDGQVDERSGDRLAVSPMRCVWQNTP